MPSDLSLISFIYSTEDKLILSLTFDTKCDTFSNRKGCDEDTHPGQILREEAPVVKGFRIPAPDDTTSELQWGNLLPGSPVKAIMSGSLRTATRVEPWNIFKMYPTPDYFRGGSFFIVKSEE